MGLANNCRLRTRDRCGAAERDLTAKNLSFGNTPVFVICAMSFGTFPSIFRSSFSLFSFHSLSLSLSLCFSEFDRVRRSLANPSIDTIRPCSVTVSLFYVHTHRAVRRPVVIFTILQLGNIDELLSSKWTENLCEKNTSDKWRAKQSHTDFINNCRNALVCDSVTASIAW